MFDGGFVLFTPLWASAKAGAGFDVLQLLPLVFVFVLMYFFLMRPQQKKAQEHKAFLANLKVGQTVVLQSGMIGRLVKLTNEQEVLIELFPDGHVRIRRNAILELMDDKLPKQVRHMQKKTTPLKGKKSQTAR